MPGWVHVWRIDLSQVEPDDGLLTDIERARAAQLRDTASRWRFVATRAAVRRILGGYLDRPPGAVPIVQHCPSCAGPHGQPRLSGDRPPLRISVAHSGRLAALAVCPDHAVGVDVEAGHPQRSPLLVAHRFAPAEEMAVLRAPMDARSAVFLRIWSRKEAYLKATGEGLSRSLSSFGVSTGERAALHWIDGDDAGRWQLSDLTFAEPAVGALVFPVGHRLEVNDY